MHVERVKDGPLRVVQDVMRGWTRRGGDMNLTGVVNEIATIAKPYRVGSVLSDRYAAGWVKQACNAAGLPCRDPDTDTSGAFLNTKPLFAEGRIDLLDHPDLVRELKVLERHARPGGRSIVEHPRGGHDD